MRAGEWNFTSLVFLKFFCKFELVRRKRILSHSDKSNEGTDKPICSLSRVRVKRSSHANTKYTPDRRQSKTFILSMNVDKKSLETEFSIAICRPTGNKWQKKHTVSSYFDLHFSIVKSILDCRLSGVRYGE